MDGSISTQFGHLETGTLGANNRYSGHIEINSCIALLFVVVVVSAGRGGDFTRMELRDSIRKAQILKDFLAVDKVYVYDSSGYFDNCVVYCTYMSGRSFIHCEYEGKYAVLNTANGVFVNINEFRQFTNMSMPCDKYGLYV